MPPIVLMVAEKPSICNAIAQALSNGSHSTRGTSPPIHEFDGEFRAERVIFRVTSVVGHVFSTDFPSEYQNWDLVDPASLFRAPIVRSPQRESIVHHLTRESNGVDYLVLWLDCDREGENICFEVIRCVAPEMKKKSKNSIQTIFRAKFSAINPKDIRTAMEHLVSPNENESLAVDARQELDLKIGVAFSRFQTRYFQGKYGDLDSTLISYGPCQTPTLGFCVDRYEEIQFFNPESFWTIDACINKNGRQVCLEWQRIRLFDQISTIAIFQNCQTFGQVIVTDKKESRALKSRPTPMNTVTMLKLASKLLGISPFSTMQSAERLYLSGYISYPRTESSSYPSSFDIRECLEMQSGSSRWGIHVCQLLGTGFTRPKSGVDAGDHPPITPVRPYDSSLSGDMGRLYDLIAGNFVASVSPDAIFMKTSVTFSCAEEVFVARGRKMIDPGFLVVLSRDYVNAIETDALQGQNSEEKDDEAKYSSIEAELPIFELGDVLQFSICKVSSGQTKPPGYLTESELIEQMERHGIGTDASIPTHVQNICERNYVTIESGRTLHPTRLGIMLVQGYHRIDCDLVLPNVRSSIEEQCNLIAKAVASKDMVVSHALANFERKFLYFVSHITAMDASFETVYSPLSETGKPMCKCGKCRRYMRLITNRPQRLHCPTCNVTYSLPQNGTIRLYKDQACPLDGFELLLFSLGNAENSQGKNFPVCPYCYNFPPYADAIEDMSGSHKNQTGAFATAGHMTCHQCLHPDCPHSQTSLKICSCPNRIYQYSEGGDVASGVSCSGFLILDVNSKPFWRLCCNICNTLVKINGDIQSIDVLAWSERQNSSCLDAICENCQSNRVEVKFSATDSDASGRIIKGCLTCDDALSDLTEIVQGSLIHNRLQKERVEGRRRARGGRRRGQTRITSEMAKMSFSEF